jgi:UDPglucose 6-dehydrogenase
MDILELERFVTQDRDGTWEDPLGRLIPEAKCPCGCADCRAKRVGMEDGETVDWEAVATLLREPKWIFDGRNIVDGPQMEQLGFKVRGVGKGPSA